MGGARDSNSNPPAKPAKGCIQLTLFAVTRFKIILFSPGDISVYLDQKPMENPAVKREICASVGSKNI
eukprot:6737912-Prymnesium_polylepis.1